LTSVGTKCSEYYFINKGTFRSYVIINGKEVTTNFFFNGFVTDYYSLINNTPCDNDIEAIEDSEVVAISYENMSMLCEKFHNYEKFSRIISEGVYSIMHQRQRQLLLNTPKQRYINLIKQRPKAVQVLPQIYIASYLGISPEYLSRLKKEIKNG